MRSKGRLGAFLEALPENLIPVLVLILATTASFGLGVLAGRDMGGGTVVGAVSASKGVHIASSTLEMAPAGSVSAETGEYVASRNGTKYYLQSCGGAGRIKEENKVWFQSVEEAVSAGYTPASNCPGL